MEFTHNLLIGVSMPLIAAIIVSEEQITLIGEGKAPDLFPIDKSEYEEVVSRFDAMTQAQQAAVSREQREYCGRTRSAIMAKNAAKRERKLEHRAPKRQLLVAQVA